MAVPVELHDSAVVDDASRNRGREAKVRRRNREGIEALLERDTTGGTAISGDGPWGYRKTRES